MKAKTKRWLSLACLLIITGAVIFGIAFVRADFNWGVLDDTKYTAQSLDLTNEVFGGNTQIDDVSLEIGSFDIDIKHGDEFGIDYHTSEYSNVDYSYTGNSFSFSLKEDWKRQLRGFSGINQSNLKVTVMIPQGIKLNLKCPSADVNMYELTLGDVSINANSSDFYINALNASKFDFTGNSANLTVTDSALTEVVLDGNSSRFALENVNITNNLVVDGSSTNAYFTNITAVNVTAIGNSSSFKFINSSFSGDMNVSGSSTNTYINKCTALSYVGEGNSSSVKVWDTQCNSVRYSGNSASFKVMDRIICDNFDFSGNSSNFQIRIVGAQDDFADIKMSGSSSNFRINDERCGSGHHQTGSGHKTFNAKGNSTTCKVWFVA